METYHWQPMGRGFNALCGLDVIPFLRTKEVWVVLTELPENEGTSVVTGAEELASQVYTDRIVPKYPHFLVRFFDHWPPDETIYGTTQGPPEARRGDRFSAIDLKWAPHHQCWTMAVGFRNASDAEVGTIVGNLGATPWPFRLCPYHHPQLANNS